MIELEQYEENDDMSMFLVHIVIFTFLIFCVCLRVCATTLFSGYFFLEMSANCALCTMSGF